MTRYGSDNLFDLLRVEHDVTADDPPAGQTQIRADAAGRLYQITPAGAETYLDQPGGFTSPMTTQDDVIVGGAAGAPDRLGKGSDGQVLTVDPTTHHLAWKTPSSGFADPMTTRGDLMIRNASNVTARLGRGGAGTYLGSDGTDLAWATPSSGFTDPMTTRGDLIIRNASNVTARLGRGSASQVLTSDGTDIAWAGAAGGGGTVGYKPKDIRANTANTNALALTVTATASGDKAFIVCGGAGNRTISSITQTNVTWTQLRLGGNPGGATGAFIAVWVGTSTGVGGTTVTVNLSASNWTGAWYIGFPSGLAGTEDSGITDVTVVTSGAHEMPYLAPTSPNALVIWGYSEADGTTPLTALAAVGSVVNPFNLGTDGTLSAAWGFTGRAPVRMRTGNSHNTAQAMIVEAIV